MVGRRLVWRKPYKQKEEIKMSDWFKTMDGNVIVYNPEIAPESREFRNETYEEVVGAREGYLKLDPRIDGLSTQLSQIATDVSSFPIINPEVDDTGRIQRAVNSITNSKIYFPKGIYSIGGNGITINKYVEIIGNESVIAIDGLNIGAHALNLDASSRKSIIDGLSFISYTNPQGAISISAHNTKITHCTFTSIKNGITLNGINGTIIEKNFFNILSQGITINGTANQTIIRDNNFFNFLTGVSNYCISLGDGVALSSIYIDMCWFELNDCINILGLNCNNVFVSNCWMEDMLNTIDYPRIKFVKSGLTSQYGNIILEKLRVIMGAIGNEVFNIDCDNITIRNVSIHKDGAQPIITLNKSIGCKIENVQLANFESPAPTFLPYTSFIGGKSIDYKDFIDNIDFGIGGFEVNGSNNEIFDSSFKVGHNCNTATTPNPTFLQDTTWGMSDNNSAKIIFPAPSGRMWIGNPVITTAVGQNILGSFWAKVDSALPIKFYIDLLGVANPLQKKEITITDKPQKFFLTYSNLSVIGDYYFHISVKADITAQAAPIILWIDDLQATLGNELKHSPYVKNDMTAAKMPIVKGLNLSLFNIGTYQFDTNATNDLLISNGGVPVFQLLNDGTLHLTTGKTIVYDL